MIIPHRSYHGAGLGDLDGFFGSIGHAFGSVGKGVGKGFVGAGKGLLAAPGFVGKQALKGGGFVGSQALNVGSSAGQLIGKAAIAPFAASAALAKGVVGGAANLFGKSLFGGGGGSSSSASPDGGLPPPPPPGPDPATVAAAQQIQQQQQQRYNYPGGGLPYSGGDVASMAPQALTTQPDPGAAPPPEPEGLMAKFSAMSMGGKLVVGGAVVGGVYVVYRMFTRGGRSAGSKS